MRILTACLVACSTLGVARAETPEPPAKRSWTRLAAERWLARAEEQTARGDTAAAITSYTEALRTDPSLGAAYLGLSEIRTTLGDPREAELLLNRATALPEVRAEALSRRARLYRSLGRDALALADLQNAALADPSPKRQRELAQLFVERRAWTAALAAWRKIRASLPEDAEDGGERQEAEDTVAALALLAGEADGAQHDMGERRWVRRALRHQAVPASATGQRGTPEVSRANRGASKTTGTSARKLAP